MSGQVWFTSDTHFGHPWIIPFCGRPYRSAAAMTAALVANWNAVVQPEDTVWHLGDFGAGDPGPVLMALNGTKHLIHGNHDEPVARQHPGWASSQAWAETVVADWRVVMCHYAMRTWPRASSGSLNFFGHTHGTLAGNRQSCDVGVDCWEYRPISFWEILAYLRTLPLRVLV